MQATTEPTIQYNNPNYGHEPVDLSTHFDNTITHVTHVEHKINVYKSPNSLHVELNEMADRSRHMELTPWNNYDGIDKKQYMPSSKEWTNSHYTFNRHSSKLLPVSDIAVNKLIKSYFNLSSLKKGRRSRRVEIRFKRLSPNRLFVSKAEIKHTNNKVTVTAYVYNRENKFLSFKMNSLRTIPESRKLLSKVHKKETFDLKPNKIRHATSKSGDSTVPGKIPGLKMPVGGSNRKDNFIIKHKLVALKSMRVLRKIRNSRRFILKYLDWSIDNFKIYENKYYKSFLKSAFKKQLLHMRYNKISYSNTNKFSNWFLIGIKSLLSKIYKKNVELNIVNLKYLYFNGDNFTEAVSDKLKNRNNRLLEVLKKVMKMVKIPSISLHSPIRFKLPSLYHKNLENMKTKYILSNNLTNFVLKKGKSNVTTGIRLEAAGRLSKRLTASRSLFKYKYKGSLKDIQYSYNDVHSTLYRGFMKPSVYYTSLSSKTRNGSFGLKGWVSSY